MIVVLVVAAAVAVLAYLDGRALFLSDIHIACSAADAGARLALRALRGKLNQFYVLERTAKTRPLQRFLLYGGRTYSYGEAYRCILRYGHWLSSVHGVRQGHVVGIYSANSDVFVFAWFGLWSIGAKPAFINCNLSGPALAHSVKIAQTTLVVAEPEFAGNFTDEIRASLNGVTVVAADDKTLAEIEATEPVRHPDVERAEPGRGFSNMAVLIYTSGTTGLPKAAIASWGKVIVISVLTTRWIRRRRSDVLYTPMPLYHGSASLMGLLGSVEAGGAIAVGRKFSARRFWDEVRECDATIIQYVGETCRYLVSAPPRTGPDGENLDRKHKVRLAIGNGLRPDVWTAFKDRFGIKTIAEFYTATEAPLATFNLSTSGFSAGAIGHTGWLYFVAMYWCVAIAEIDFDTDELRRDGNGRCQRVRPNARGELIFRVPFANMSALFQGYYNNPEASREKMVRDAFSKGDAWFRTGDVVRLDSAGRLFFCDRIGDTFRWKGENVSTAEVAAVVGSHAAVREANVYGVELPHHDGRAGCAAVVVEDEQKTLQGLGQHVTTLPPYARPLFLRVMPGLESSTTGTMKQQKHVLRSEGVRPSEGRMFWLRGGGAYVPFGEQDWEGLCAGRVKL